jgi:hypothetical protein
MPASKMQSLPFEVLKENAFRKVSLQSSEVTEAVLLVLHPA